MKSIVAFLIGILAIGLLPGVALGSSVDIPGVFFKTGHPTKGEPIDSSVHDSKELKNLAGSVAILKRYPNIRVKVIGHTDQYECSGQECHDLALRRALLVYWHLLDAGIDPKRVISLMEYSSTRPIAGKREDFMLNQRAEISFALEP